MTENVIICLEECENTLWEAEIVKISILLCISFSLSCKSERCEVELPVVRRVGVARPYAPRQHAKARHRAENRLEMHNCVALQHFLCQHAG